MKFAGFPIVPRNGHLWDKFHPARQDEFKKLDTDGSNTLEMNEFRQLLLGLTKNLTVGAAKPWVGCWISVFFRERSEAQAPEKNSILAAAEDSKGICSQGTRGQTSGVEMEQIGDEIKNPNAEPIPSSNQVAPNNIPWFFLGLLLPKRMVRFVRTKPKPSSCIAATSKKQSHRSLSMSSKCSGKTSTKMAVVLCTSAKCSHHHLDLTTATASLCNDKERRGLSPTFASGTWRFLAEQEDFWIDFLNG